MFLSLDLLLSGFVYLQETAVCTLKHVQTLIIHYNSWFNVNTYMLFRKVT